MGNDKLTLDKLLTYYQASLHAEGKSAKTVEWYIAILDTFYRYLEDSMVPPELDELTINTVRGYILYLQKKPRFQNHPFLRETGEYLSPRTVQCHVRSLKAFFSWLHREGFTDENRLQKLKLPKAPRTVIEPLRSDEISRILGATSKVTSAAIRDHAIVITLLDTGLRASELMNLKLEDAHIEQRSLKVMGKGNKERVVPIGTVAQKALLRYIYHSRPESNNVDYLFLTLDGYHLGINGLKLMLSRLAARSGVERLHAHLCRHTFAVNYLLNGGDVFSLQQILGHSSLDMVRNYLTLTSSDVKNQHHRFSPMDRMNLRRSRSSVQAKRDTVNIRS